MAYLDGELDFIVAGRVDLAIDHGKSYGHLRSVRLGQGFDVLSWCSILIGARIVKHDLEVIRDRRLHGCSG